MIILQAENDTTVKNNSIIYATEVKGHKPIMPKAIAKLMVTVESGSIARYINEIEECIAKFLDGTP